MRPNKVRPVKQSDGNKSSQKLVCRAPYVNQKPEMNANRKMWERFLRQNCEGSLKMQ